MRILKRIKSTLFSKSEPEIRNFEEELKRIFGFKDFLYVTVEGLPVMGTFSRCEELSAKVPEIMKSLSELENSDVYTIVLGDSIYTLLKVSDDVLMLAKGLRILKEEDIKELIKKSREELRI